MKKAVIVFVLFALLFPMVSAVQVSMNSNFDQGETLIAKISGSFLSPVQDSNILLYEGHVRVSFIPSVSSYNDSYYVYGQLTNKREGNYSLVLTGASYFEFGKKHTEDVYKNFTITNSSADFSVEPGFVDADKDFYITVQNLVGDDVKIDSSLYNSDNSFISGTENSDYVSPGEPKRIYFSVENLTSSEFEARLSSSNTTYSIPVFLSLPNQIGNVTNSFDLQPTELNISMATNSSTGRYLYIHNNGQDEENIILNISLPLSDYISAPDNITIGPNDTKIVEILIVSPTSEGLVNGSINFTAGNLTKTAYLILNFSQAYNSANNPINDSQTLFQTCAQRGGIFCNDTSICSGSQSNTQDGKCCIGKCELQTSNESGKIIGWALIFTAVIILAILLVKRYSKAKHGPINFFKR